MLLLLQMGGQKGLLLVAALPNCKINIAAPMGLRHLASSPVKSLVTENIADYGYDIVIHGRIVDPQWYRTSARQSNQRGSVSTPSHSVGITTRGLERSLVDCASKWRESKYRSHTRRKNTFERFTLFHPHLLCISSRLDGAVASADTPRTIGILGRGTSVSCDCAFEAPLRRGHICSSRRPWWSHCDNARARYAQENRAVSCRDSGSLDFVGCTAVSCVRRSGVAKLLQTTIDLVDGKEHARTRCVYAYNVPTMNFLQLAPKPIKRRIGTVGIKKSRNVRANPLIGFGKQNHIMSTSIGIVQ
jgi:hypothetical protein